MLARSVVFMLLIKSCLTWDYSMDVKKSYYSYSFEPSKALGSDAKFVVKVIVEKELLAVGVCLNQEWFLTARVFGNKWDPRNRLRIATWDSSIRDYDKGFKGESRPVDQVMEHPFVDTLKHCNYDLALLGVTQPIEYGPSLKMISIKGVTKPRAGTKCLMMVAFQNGVYAKEIELKALDDCKKHMLYKDYKWCGDKHDMFCIKVDEPVYGAPIICEDKLVGIFSAIVDPKYNLSVFHYAGSFSDWIEDHLTFEIQNEPLMKRQASSCTIENCRLLNIFTLLALKFYLN